MLRRIVQDVETGKPELRQRGYVYQKGKRKGDQWNPMERTYGRYRIDVPGIHKQKEVRIALGYCRDELDAMLRLQREMTDAGVRDLEKVRDFYGFIPRAGSVVGCRDVSGSNRKRKETRTV